MHARKFSRPALLSLGLLFGLLAPPRSADAAGAGESSRGPLVDAHAIEITIAEKGGGELGVMLPLPDRKQGDAYPWSEAEVSRVRDGESGFCRVRVRRGHDDPAHDLDLYIKCAHRKDEAVDTDLRLETTHTFTRRKKSVVAQFSQPDGAATTVTVTAR